MEHKDIQSMIRERFSDLPPKLQEAITSTDVTSKLRELTQKHRLHIDQGQKLENETYMVLLGIEDAEKYEGNLQRELKIPHEEAKKVAQDVAKEIFLSIREALKKTAVPSQEPVQKTETYEQHVAKEADSVTPAIPPPPPSVEEKIDKLPHTEEEQKKEAPAKETPRYTTDPYREPIE